jgi:hypothetical protein
MPLSLCRWTARALHDVTFQLRTTSFELKIVALCTARWRCGLVVLHAWWRCGMVVALSVSTTQILYDHYLFPRLNSAAVTKKNTHRPMKIVEKVFHAQMRAHQVSLPLGGVPDRAPK